MRHRPTPVLAAIAVAFLAAAMGLPSRLQTSKNDDLQGIVLMSSTSGAFAIKGQVSSLYPGQVTTLPLTLVNPNGFSIKVTSVAVKVGSPSKACTYANVSVAKFAGSLAVGPHSSRRLSLALTMSRSAPNACQGARFSLSYRGTAVRA